MTAFIVENIGTIIVSALVLTIVVLAVRKMIKDRKSGSSCSSCSGCSMSDTCHKH